MVVQKIMILIGFLAVTGARAQQRELAALKKISPTWLSPQQWVKGVNRSYIDCSLCDIKSKTPKSTIDYFLDPKYAKESASDFWAYQRQMEMRQNYGMMGPLNHYQVQLEKFNPHGAKYVDVYATNRLLTDSIKNRMIDNGTQQEFEINKIEKGPTAQALHQTTRDIDRTVRKIESAVFSPISQDGKRESEPKVVTKMKSKGSKATVSADVAQKKVSSEDWLQAKLGAKTDLVGMRGQVFMKSKLLNSEVDLVAHQPLTHYVSSNVLGSRLVSRMNFWTDLDRINAEPVRFKLYRDVPLVDVHASWMYGFNSNTMVSSLSKNFTSFLRAEVSRIDNFSVPSASDQRVGLFLERVF